jgi:hypothetical protein
MNEVQLTGHIRRIVDPQLMRLRSELFGTTYNSTIKETLVPVGGLVEQIVYEINEYYGIASPYIELPAGAAGVQKGRVVYYDQTHVHHASAATLDHMERILGVTQDSAAADAMVRVQILGLLDFPDVYSFSAYREVFVGLDGVLVQTLPPTGVYIRAMGSAITAGQVRLDIQQGVVIL